MIISSMCGHRGYKGSSLSFSSCGLPLALPCYLPWHLSSGFCGRGHSLNQLSSSPDFICNINNSLCSRKLGRRYSELLTHVLYSVVLLRSRAPSILPPDSRHHYLFTGEHNRSTERCCSWIRPSREPRHQASNTGQTVGKDGCPGNLQCEQT